MPDQRQPGGAKQRSAGHDPATAGIVDPPANDRRQQARHQQRDRKGADDTTLGRAEVALEVTQQRAEDVIDRAPRNDLRHPKAATTTQG